MLEEITCTKGCIHVKLCSLHNPIPINPSILKNKLIPHPPQLIQHLSNKKTWPQRRLRRERKTLQVELNPIPQVPYKEFLTLVRKQEGPPNVLDKTAVPKHMERRLPRRGAHRTQVRTRDMTGKTFSIPLLSTF